MRKITLSILTLIYALNCFSQNSWTLSMTGYDQTYSPADFVTATNGDVYVNGVKYDSGISGFINKLYKSTNQGASWTEVTTSGLTNLGNVHTLTISGNKMILGGMDVVSANGAKIFTSTDNGATWTLSMTGYDQTYSPADFVTASNGDIYVNGVKYDNGISGFINKLYKSTNQGASWTEVTTSGLTNLGNVHTLTISGNKMILGGMDVVSANGAKIFTSGVTITTGFNEAALNTIVNIFPNPSNDVVNIDFADIQPKAVTLTSMTGKIIKQISSTSNQTIQLDISELSSGHYLIIVDNASEIQTFKLLKR